MRVVRRKEDGPVPSDIRTDWTVYFRKRLAPEILGDINELIIMKSKSKTKSPSNSNNDNSSPPDGDDSGTQQLDDEIEVLVKG